MRSMILMLPLLLVACYKTPLVNFSGGQGSPGQVVKVWNSSLILGLVPLSEVDVRAACGDKGVWSVTTQMSFVNLLLNGITGGIYSPTTAKITCRG